MNVSVDTSIHRRLERVSWFAASGESSIPQLAFECQWIHNRAAALTLFDSEVWSDAKTQAQGDLTGYLAKHHYKVYGGQWNDLAEQSRVLLDKTVAPMVSSAIASIGLAKECLPAIVLDLNRGILEMSYRQHFPRVPVFFEHLLIVYEVGRLPCGWDGDLDAWPCGRLIAY